MKTQKLSTPLARPLPVTLFTFLTSTPARRWGAHAAGVLFSAARRKLRPTNFLPQRQNIEWVTMVWAGRPNQHARRVRPPFPFWSSGFCLCALLWLMLFSAGNASAATRYVWQDILRPTPPQMNWGMTANLFQNAVDAAAPTSAM